LHPFAIMSVSKPFVFALVCESLGAERARAELGVNATGLPFDSVVAIERGPEGRTNPMVNPGAIATTSLVPGTTAEAKWRCLHEGLSAFAGRTLTVDEEIYASASTSNDRNRGIAHALRGCGRIAFDSVETLDLYTRQCSLSVTARDLAVMGATLADGGVNPCTRERVVSAGACSRTLAVMTTAGLYETSGDQQGRARHIRPAARRGWQQHQRPTDGKISGAAPRPRHIRFAAGRGLNAPRVRRRAPPDARAGARVARDPAPPREPRRAHRPAARPQGKTRATRSRRRRRT
jgi:hypothetical protein